jgi:hypothetical protein
VRCSSRTAADRRFEASAAGATIRRLLEEGVVAIGERGIKLQGTG